MIKFFQTDFNRETKEEEEEVDFRHLVLPSRHGERERTPACISNNHLLFIIRTKTIIRYGRKRGTMRVISLQHHCYSIFVLLGENCIDRTRKKSCCAGAINPSIKSVSFPFSSIDIHTLHNHHHQQLVILASSFFLSFFCCCCCCCCRRCGKKSGIDKRLSIPSDKDNHLLRD